MANDKKNSRSFDLDKGGKRSFDLEKKSTRSFDLTKDEPEAAAPTVAAPKPAKPSAQPTSSQQNSTVPPTPATPIDNGNGEEGGSKKKWLWVVLAIIVLVVLAYLFIPGGRTEAITTGTDSTETVMGDSTAAEPKDSVSEDTTATTANLTESPSVDEGSESVSDPQSTYTPSSKAPSAQQQNVTDDLSPEKESSNAAAPVGSIDEQAQQVIKGVYGNNPERRQKLGADYKTVQKRVNELMRK